MDNYKEYPIDALRCPVCKDVVCSHRDIDTENHVPRCCGYVFSVIEDWDEDNHRWVVKVVCIPEQDWEELGECEDIVEHIF